MAVKEILAIIFLISPTIYFGVKQKIEYEINITKLITDTTVYQWFIIFLLITYSLWTFNTGADEVINSKHISSLKMKIFLMAYVLPGFAFSLVIFPKASSETFGIYDMLARFKLHIQITKIIGTISLILCGILIFFIFRNLEI